MTAPEDLQVLHDALIGNVRGDGSISSLVDVAQVLRDLQDAGYTITETAAEYDPDTLAQAFADALDPEPSTDGTEGGTGQVRAHADPAAGAHARDRALAGTRARRPEDVAALTRAVLQVAADLPDGFTGDDVWLALGDEAETLGDGRALGVAFRQARAAGRITPTPEFRPSTRPARHGGPVRVWRAVSPSVEEPG